MGAPGTLADVALGSADATGSAEATGISAAFAVEMTSGSSPELGFAGGGVSPQANRATLATPTQVRAIAGIHRARNEGAFMTDRVRLCRREIKVNDGPQRR